MPCRIVDWNLGWKHDQIQNAYALDVLRWILCWDVWFRYKTWIAMDLHPGQFLCAYFLLACKLAGTDHGLGDFWSGSRGLLKWSTGEVRNIRTFTKLPTSYLYSTNGWWLMLVVERIPGIFLCSNPFLMRFSEDRLNHQFSPSANHWLMYSLHFVYPWHHRNRTLDTPAGGFFPAWHAQYWYGANHPSSCLHVWMGQQNTR